MSFSRTVHYEYAFFSSIEPGDLLVKSTQQANPNTYSGLMGPDGLDNSPRNWRREMYTNMAIGALGTVFAFLVLKWVL